jgi:hypothetical protein
MIIHSIDFFSFLFSKTNRGINNDENNLYNQPDEIKEYEKKFIIPQLMVPQ